MAAFAAGLQMSWDVLEYRISVCYRFNTQLSLEFRFRRHVVLVEDFVLAIGNSRDGKDQPLLIREVLFLKADS